MIINIFNFTQVPKTNNETLHAVSIDFWEQYDPAEVGAKGFALIGSELFHIPAICYLCGSAGKEPVSNYPGSFQPDSINRLNLHEKISKRC